MIIKVVKPKSYTSISNIAINDSRLSWEARGVLIWLLSKPSNWIVSREALVNQGPAGREKVGRILNELESLGYLVRNQNRNADGTFTYESEVYEEPGAANPSAVESAAAKPPLIITDLIITDPIKTDQTDICQSGFPAKRKRKRESYDDLFEVFWTGYPRTDGGSKKKAALALAKYKPTPEFVEMIVADAKKRFKTRDHEFIPLATTYLNGAMWEADAPRGAWDGVLLVQSAPARLTMAPEVAKSNADYLKSAAQRVIAAKDRELGRTERIAAQ